MSSNAQRKRPHELFVGPTLKAWPMISSAWPLAYTSALSKKLTPACLQAVSSSLACNTAGALIVTFNVAQGARALSEQHHY